MSYKVLGGEYSLWSPPEGSGKRFDNSWDEFWARQNNYLAQTDFGQWIGVEPIKLWASPESMEEGDLKIEGNDTLQYAEELQKKQWEREDMIRQETQEREDNAWQRAVADMRAAGINPNLVNASAAASGGGITSATGVNTTLTEKEMDLAWKELETYIMNEFNASENQKDRIAEMLNNIARIYSMSAILKK